jgi:type VI secretion system FHA domain protein
VRRFCCRPSAVAFDASGSADPLPWARRRLGSFRRNSAATASARACDSFPAETLRRNFPNQVKIGPVVAAAAPVLAAVLRVASDLSRNPDVDQLRRAMTEGIRELLISRAAIKAEMGILQTIIRSEGSNALKFSITADDAVASLLAPGRPGYMDPLAAAQEAVEDIKLHELAVIVGMRNALEALLRRFDPTALEQRMAKENLLEAVLPSARKARYWDAFRVVYRDISRETENDFQSKFGRSFAEAYMTLARKDSEQNQ